MFPRHFMVLVALGLTMQCAFTLVITESTGDQTVAGRSDGVANTRHQRRYMGALEKLVKRHLNIRNPAAKQANLQPGQSSLHKSNKNTKAIKHPQRPKPKLSTASLFDEIIPNMKMRIPHVSALVQNHQTKETLKQLYHSLSAIQLMLSQL